jgi:hypothetical protein
MNGPKRSKKKDKSFLHNFMSHPKLFAILKNPFLHDLSELEAKKSAIFSLPIHSNHVKKEFFLTRKNSG